jgi:hypothetical protein
MLIARAPNSEVAGRRSHSARAFDAGHGKLAGGCRWSRRASRRHPASPGPAHAGPRHEAGTVVSPETGGSCAWRVPRSVTRSIPLGTRGLWGDGRHVHPAGTRGVRATAASSPRGRSATETRSQGVFPRSILGTIASTARSLGSRLGRIPSRRADPVGQLGAETAWSPTAGARRATRRPARGSVAGGNVCVRGPGSRQRHPTPRLPPRHGGSEPPTPEAAQVVPRPRNETAARRSTCFT